MCGQVLFDSAQISNFFDEIVSVAVGFRLLGCDDDLGGFLADFLENAIQTGAVEAGHV